MPTGSTTTRVTILGATGSIGASTLDVLARHPEQYQVFALSADRNVDSMVALCHTHRPTYAVMADAAPTLSAVEAGKRVLLANKESLVMAGQLMMDAVEKNGATLLPIDSEHNAIFQCLPQTTSGIELRGVQKILLTASGGPFRQLSADELHDVTPARALKHPNWSMGQKVTIDSASLMNKGLELIEACWLFDVTPNQIDVVVHPQSIVHSMVSYDDGSILAQLGNPDMRTPIAHALAWPERVDSGVAQLDMTTVAQLNFEKPDTQRFPCLRLAFEAAAAGGTATTVMNAADEIAVPAFLDGRIRFTDIPAHVEEAMQRLPVVPVDSVETLFEMDRKTRALVEASISRTTLAVTS